MIISASRRTDIPAFYARWMVNRLRAGYCCVPNPFNRSQVSQIDLSPDAVDCIVFWTRNPHPLMAHLDEIDRMGYRYYFQFTILDNPRLLDPHVPPLEAALNAARQLAGRIDPGRIIWRYDPIVLSSITGVDFHARAYGHIARALEGCAKRSVISIMDRYPKVEGRLRALEKQGVQLMDPARTEEAVIEVVPTLAGIAAKHGMRIQSCADDLGMAACGVEPGKCVDDALILDEFGIRVSPRKDPVQRTACRCVVSRDIGMYDSCPHGCVYCYAAGKPATVQKNVTRHDPQSPSLIGWYEAGTITKLP